MATMSLILGLGGLLSLIPSVTSQTYTNCNPLNVTCPADLALATNATFNFTQISAEAYNDVWNTTNANTVDYTDSGADFVIGGQGDAPTLVSNFYLFWGIASVVMKASPGQGIVSSIVLQSDDLDEMDWEFLGGNNTMVQTNYFGKGNTTYPENRMQEIQVDDPQNQYHNYTYHWTSEKLEWLIDDVVVRTLMFADAGSGDLYPQTPCQLRIGSWAGGDPNNNSPGTVAWAGGDVNWDDAPFTMNVQAVYVQDFSSGKEYKYSDNSGSFESIEVVNGTSSVADEINSPHGLTERYKALSTGAKVGIACGAIGFVAVCSGLLAFYCIKQRRTGRREAALLDNDWNKEQAELVQYRQKMTAGEFGQGSRL